MQVVSSEDCPSVEFAAAEEWAPDCNRPSLSQTPRPHAHCGTTKAKRQIKSERIN